MLLRYDNLYETSCENTTTFRVIASIVDNF